MQKLDPTTKILTDFIYYYPEIAVDMLNKRGYSIDKETATLRQINELVFKALYLDNNEGLASDIDDFVSNGGYKNFAMAVIAGVSALSSLMGTFGGAAAAAKQRELLKNLALADLAQQEKLQFENIRTQAETERIKILLNSNLEYRKTLQSEATIRLRDTWIYMAAVGCIMAIFYGLYLVKEKK